MSLTTQMRHDNERAAQQYQRKSTKGDRTIADDLDALVHGWWAMMTNDDHGRVDWTRGDERQRSADVSHIHPRSANGPRNPMPRFRGPLCCPGPRPSSRWRQ